MRLFVAVYPPPAALADLDARVDRGADGAGAVRWSPLEQWHLTLVFLGEVAEGRLDELRERLARAAARSAPMTLALHGVGTFPRQAHRARVLWCGLTGDVGDLRLLADRCRAAARRTGIEVEDRAFRAHLTLARARDREADLTAWVADLASYDGPRWRADEVRLMRSHLGGGPARHEVLAASPLRA